MDAKPVDGLPLPGMDEDDDLDFWTTYISVTPEEDEDFAASGCVWLIIGAIAAAVTVVAAVVLLR